MKTCHTKLDDKESGNAITVNSSFTTVKHFFCHCSICDDGYDDYSQLSSHERDKHTFKCTQCDYNCMAQADLSTHVATQHVKKHDCNLCEESFSDTNSLTVHKETNHTEMGTDVSCQTDANNCEESMATKTYPNEHLSTEHGPTIVKENIDAYSQTEELKCVKCEESKKRTQYMDVLEKEHLGLKDVHTRLQQLYCNQSTELTDKMEKNQSLENDFTKVKLEFEKYKKDATKMEKLKETKLKDQQNELGKFYDEVNKVSQENVKLKEENKTLHELKNINDLLQKEKTSQSIEEDESMNDEDVAAFYAEQNRDRRRRSNPQSSADSPQENEQTENRNKFACGLCQFQTSNENLLQKHVTSIHGGEAGASGAKQCQQKTDSKLSCSMCEFRTTNESILRRHKSNTHKNSGSFVCEKCAFSTPLETNLKLHKEAMHRVESNTTSSTRTNDNMDDDDDDEYPNDEEVAAFYAEQNENRRRRTNPQSSADAPQTSKQTENQSKFVCSRCEFQTSSEGILKKHVSSIHVSETGASRAEQETNSKLSCSKCGFKTTNENILKRHESNIHGNSEPLACEKCNFSTTKKINLKWHMEAMHRPENNFMKHARNDENTERRRNKICSFYLNGFCRYSEQQCKFRHESPPRCRYQMDCAAWPDCGFTHDAIDNVMACHYQERCRSNNCQFTHFGSNGERFLGRGQPVPAMNMHNYPPLFPNQGMNQRGRW